MDVGEDVHVRKDHKIEGVPTSASSTWAARQRLLTATESGRPLNMCVVCATVGVPRQANAGERGGKSVQTGFDPRNHLLLSAAATIVTRSLHQHQATVSMADALMGSKGRNASFASITDGAYDSWRDSSLALDGSCCRAHSTRPRSPS